MFVVSYTWDTFEEEFQVWQEARFSSAYEAEQFVMSLIDDGVAVVRTFKEPFNR